MSKAYHALREWGAFVSSNIDFADEWGENILRHYSQFGYTDSQVGNMKVDDDGALLGRDTILCPNMPARLQKVEIAVNKLSDLRRNCIVLWFCSPLNVDGHPHNARKLADMLMITMKKFTYEVGRGQNDVERML